MRRIVQIIIPGLIVGCVLAYVVSAFMKPSVKSAPAELIKPINSDGGTFADKNVQKAQQLIEQQADNPKGYNQLCAAFLQKSRETGDFGFNVRADEALKYSFQVAPDNFDAIKLHAAVLLNYHRFADALKESQRALTMNPRDHEVYGAMVDSYVELGDYDKAVETAQKMVDLRPDTASYSRISYLRSLHGDSKGSIEIMRKAIEAADPHSPEEAAWCRVHLGDELMNSGNLKDAEKEYDHALYIFPDYHLALAAKARARYAANDLENAVAYFKKASERMPLPDYIAALGDLYAKTGRADEAKQQYDQVEFIEKTSAAAGTYTRQLAVFWADHDLRLDDALAAAKNERAIRSDIYTSDALAWCLYKKGQFAEAKNSMDEAMRIGSRDPKLLYHAGMIAAANNDNQKAADYLKQALDANPAFDILQADIARDKLKSLKS